jgi:SAM-dependent methyltransferase
MDCRLAREVQHFDQHYAGEASLGIDRLSEADRVRYRCPGSDTIYPREYAYHLLSPLAGREVLEIACGNGIDACICAHNGAEVFAYDASPRSVAMVRQRAEVNGLSDRVHVQTAWKLEDAYPGRTFDAILGYAALHHLPLEGLAEAIHARLRPGGVAVFVEPVVNSRALSRVRALVPWRLAEPTEDEQPLDDAQIAAFARPFGRMVRREFQMISRIWPLFPGCSPLVKGVHWADYHLLRIPLLRRYASVVAVGLYRA